MAKKDKPGSTPTTKGPALTHNPFAALSGAKPAPAAPAPEPAPTPTHDREQASKLPDHSATKPLDAAPAGLKAKSRGRVVLRRETKHRGGKAVILVTGLAALRDFDMAAIEKLAKELKQQLGCGGTVEASGSDTHIVLQGDRAAKVAELLRARGFRVDGVTS